MLINLFYVYIVALSSSTLLHVAHAGGTRVAFGELGLITDRVRSATVVSEVASEFAVITKQEFDTVLKRYMRR